MGSSPIHVALVKVMLVTASWFNAKGMLTHCGKKINLSRYSFCQIDGLMDKSEATRELLGL